MDNEEEKKEARGEANTQMKWIVQLNLQKHLCTLKHQFIFKFLQHKSLFEG